MTRDTSKAAKLRELGMEGKGGWEGGIYDIRANHMYRLSKSKTEIPEMVKNDHLIQSGQILPTTQPKIANYLIFKKLY